MDRKEDFNHDSNGYLFRKTIGISNNPMSGMLPKSSTETFYTTPFENKLIHSERRAFASEIGRICEKAALDNWSGNRRLDRDNLELKELFEGVREEIQYKKILSKPMSHEELTNYYQITKPYHPTVPGKEEEGQGNDVPTSINLATLFSRLDKIFNSQLMDKYRNLGSVFDVHDNTHKLNENIRYLIEGSLILGRIVLEPKPFNFGNLFPSVSINKNNHGGVEFDGVFSNADFQNPNDPGQKDYGVLEIKTVLRSNLISGQNSLSHVRREDIAQLRAKIGKYILLTECEWPFPNFMAFAYLRGTRPHFIKTIRLDSEYIRDWMEGLNTMWWNPDKYLFSVPLDERQQFIDDASRLYLYLNDVATERREEEDKEAIKREERLLEIHQDDSLLVQGPINKNIYEPEVKPLDKKTKVEKVRRIVRKRNPKDQPKLPEVEKTKKSISEKKKLEI